MKYIFILLTTLFSISFVSPSFSQWTQLTMNYKNDIFYLDYERIRKIDDNVYFWYLIDFSEKNRYGLSFIYYKEGDCKLFRFKSLQLLTFSERMGKGNSRDETPLNPKWYYPTPNSINEGILKIVCNHIN